MLVAVPIVPSAQVVGRQFSVTVTILLMAGFALVGLLLIGVALRRDTVQGLHELRRTANALADGNLDEEFESTREDEVGELFRAFGEMRDSLRDRIEESDAERAAAEEAQAAAETERERAEAAAAETERFAQRLEERAAAFSDVMAECARGDLTRRLNADADNEAMQEVAVAFNETITEIEQTVADVIEFADEVATASRRVREHAMQVSETGQEVSGSIDQISDGASRQNERLQSVSSDVDEMSATIEEVAASADEVASTSRAAATAGSEGRDAAGEAVRELHDIREQTEETATSVAALEEQMDRIGDITDVITRIADQTNILALNARIEAARAGEAGDGFAVVSNEVKQLAEETRESAAEIESLIETVQEQTADSVAEMSRIEDRVREGVETVEETQDALVSVVDRVEETDVGVQEISRAMDDQASAVGDIAATVDELASIGEETTAEAATVADSAEEQAATLGDVGEDATTLVEKADILERSLGAFTTGAAADTAGIGAGDVSDGDDEEEAAKDSNLMRDPDPGPTVDEAAYPVTVHPVRTDGSTDDVEPESDAESRRGATEPAAETNTESKDDTAGDEDDVFEWVGGDSNA